MQMAIDVGRVHARRGRPAPPGDGLQAQPASGWSGCTQRFSDGAAERGVTAEVAEELWEKLAAFANYGFPESHSVSFAYLVYASSWLKRYYPAAFCAALLNAQPMGFYSPHTLVQDARRHGVEVRSPDLNASERRPPPWRSTASTSPAPAHAGAPPETWGSAGRRCGSGSRRCGASATTWPRPSPPGRPYADPEDLARRSGALACRQLEALATAGAFDCFGLAPAPGAVGGGRRGPVARPIACAGIVTGADAPRRCRA